MQLLTYSEAVAEVVHAVSHDDHPGDAGDPSILHLLVRVAVPSVGVSVTVGVSVLPGFLGGVPGGRLGLLCRSQRGLCGGGVGGLELCQLGVVVSVVAGDS